MSHTRAEAAFLEIRRRLLSGEFSPGAPLRLERLKSELGIGITPLREALMRLTSESLVVAEEQRGFRVAPATQDDLEDIMRTRIEIEALALREAMDRGGDDWEATIVGAFHRLSRRNPTDPDTGAMMPDWEAAHAAFHVSLIAACESRWIKHFWQTLFDHSRRYRQIAVVRGRAYRDDLAEHERLMRAVLARDVEAALAASAAHIASTRAVVEVLLDGEAIAPVMAGRDDGVPGGATTGPAADAPAEGPQSAIPRRGPQRPQ
jgi:DNA-binding GntR family transcriptional regulator